MITAKRYCEYIFCDCPNKKMPKFKKSFDRGCRFLHKKCYKNCLMAEDLIKRNPLNINYTQCIASKANGERCKCNINSDGFDTKTGYCKYHNYMKYWLIHG